MSEKPVKLTKPQAELLRDVAIKPRSGGRHYPPLMKLLALGFVEEKPGWIGTSYAITAAGRAHPAATTSGDAP